MSDHTSRCCCSPRVAGASGSRPSPEHPAPGLLSPHGYQHSHPGHPGPDPMVPGAPRPLYRALLDGQKTQRPKHARKPVLPAPNPGLLGGMDFGMAPRMSVRFPFTPQYEIRTQTRITAPAVAPLRFRTALEQRVLRRHPGILLGSQVDRPGSGRSSHLRKR
jgi:hypothetical protein